MPVLGLARPHPRLIILIPKYGKNDLLVLEGNWGSEYRVLGFGFGGVTSTLAGGIYALLYRDHYEDPRPHLPLSTS